MITYISLLHIIFAMTSAYTNWNPMQVMLERNRMQSGKSCAAFDISLYFGKKHTAESTETTKFTVDIKYETIGTESFTERARSVYTGDESDIRQLFVPWPEWKRYLNKIIYGEITDEDELIEETTTNKYTNRTVDPNEDSEELNHYVSGKIFRSELFQNRSAVHFPFSEYLFKGHSRLNLTNDLMQTALNAFAIIIKGNMDDLLAMPSEYLLLSSRAISMIKLRREKFAAIWTAVKGERKIEEIDIGTLELYRPLFKYVSAKEMARLNLNDERILKYIGTHPDLDRLQVGVVASKYMQINPRWMEATYLNMMNNLLCGIPITVMRRIPENTFLQLSHQIFYHTRACDPLQRRFYLFMMTKSQALGKSYSWSASDVSRLGYLLIEVERTSLSSVNPESMVGISSRVMLAMPPENLLYFTERQVKHLSRKSYNFYAMKMKKYKEYQDQFNCHSFNKPLLMLLIMNIFVSTNVQT